MQTVEWYTPINSYWTQAQQWSISKLMHDKLVIDHHCACDQYLVTTDQWKTLHKFLVIHCSSHGVFGWLWIFAAVNDTSLLCPVWYTLWHSLRFPDSPHIHAHQCDNSYKELHTCLTNHQLLKNYRDVCLFQSIKLSRRADI